MRSDLGWIPNHIANNVSYWINFPKEELFSDNSVIDNLSKVILAAYDFHNVEKTL